MNDLNMKVRSEWVAFKETFLKKYRKCTTLQVFLINGLAKNMSRAFVVQSRREKRECKFRSLRTSRKFEMCYFPWTNFHSGASDCLQPVWFLFFRSHYQREKTSRWLKSFCVLSEHRAPVILGLSAGSKSLHQGRGLSNTRPLFRLLNQR